MSDPNKRIHNPLFNPNVTGGGYEEFSQHAVLFPAEEVTHPVDFNTPEFNLQPPGTSVQAPSAFLQPPNPQQSAHVPISIPVGYQQEGFDPRQSQWSNQTLDSNPQSRLEEGPSQISSLISSFSNIWKRSTDSPPSTLQRQEDTAGVTAYFTPTPIAPPVPLFSPYDASLAQTNRPPPPSTATTNTYRRVGSKRPVYAPIPGLSSTSQPTPKEPQRPPSSNSPYSQSPSISPSFGTTTPKHYTPFAKHNIFENTCTPPIPFTPPSPKALNLIAESCHVSNPELFTPTAPQTNTLQTNSPFLSPVDDFNYLSNAPELTSITPIMSAIPANDLMESQDNLLARSDGVSNPMTTNAVYRPVYHHWFYKKLGETRAGWKAFSMIDSLELENAFTSLDLSPEKVVATDGGRYDVNILRRQRKAVYWKSEPTEVRRCSWFHKGNTDGKFVPFEENIATKLEDEFKAAFEINQWHSKIELNNGETVMFHGPDVLVLFPPAQSPDAWGNTPPGQPKPRTVKRGLDEFDIDEGESTNIDHLLFMVHGIGSVCDLKFRSVEEVVDEFRNIALQLVRSHYRSSCEQGISHRVEVLPISWHDKLHSEDTGIDKKLKGITLESIPKLRDFTNDTLLDILFYTSPVYCQTIISTVGNELNRIYDLFKQRNPKFKGGISLGGHSLGSLILFDILCHQHPEPEADDTANESGEDILKPLQESKPPHPRHRRMSRRISYMMGSVGTGQPQITYPHLCFQPVTFFALGSPVGMFVTIRGLDTLGDQFVLPTCQGFFNIFHPYDPVAYRIESLVNPELSTVKPVLIPHHKGRKRMHLELKETMSRVGADLKHKVFDSMKNTWNSLFQLGFFKQQQPGFQAEVNKVLEEELAKEQMKDDQIEDVQTEATDLCLGMLNKGRRIDYVLQEAPFEFFNEYIFALSSHVCYWESEDTILLMLKEIYDMMNVSPDCQIPQQTMTIERPISPISSRAAFGVDPTMPMSSNTNLGPPPIAGFVKKT